MIEVFKTDVQNTGEAKIIIAMLHQHFPASRINFDLNDCDRILRVEGNDFCTETIILLMKENGFHCTILE